jgi:hypothetical protein
MSGEAMSTTITKYIVAELAGGVAIDIALDKLLKDVDMSDVHQSEDERRKALGELIVEEEVEVAGYGSALPMNVKHSRYTLEVFRPDFESAISNPQNDYIFLEYFDKEIAESKPEVDRITINGTGHEFFRGIAEICVEHSKDIIVVNPQYPLALGIDMASRVSHIVSTLALNPGRALAQEFKLPGHVGHIVNAALLTPSVLAWLSHVPHIPNELKHNLFDWRDVHSALGIIEAFRRYGSTQQAAPVIQGKGHAPTFYYVKNPLTAKIKRHTYPLFNSLGNLSTGQRFHYIKGQWKIVDQFKY